MRRQRCKWRVTGASWGGVCALFIAALPSAAVGITQAELDAHRDLWNTHGSDDYDFFVQRICFCHLDFIRPGWVQVRDGVIVSVTDAETHEPLDPLAFPTIDGLFDELQAAVDLPAYMIEAEFHERLGYPTSIRLDLVEFIADDETSYVVRDVTLVPEPTSLLLALLCAVGIIRQVRRHAPAAVK